MTESFDSVIICIYRALPHNPLKELFREKFLKNLQKLLKKGIFLDVYLSLRPQKTEVAYFIRYKSASRLMALLKLK